MQLFQHENRASPLVAVPREVPCGNTGPGVRCAGDPCAGASCAVAPDAACAPFYCQRPVLFRGVNVTQRPCSAVFVDPASGDPVDCTTAVRPPLAGDNNAGGKAGTSSAGTAPFAAISKAAAALAASRGSNASLWQTLLDSGELYCIVYDRWDSLLHI